MSTQTPLHSVVVRAPAKLNLFLELLGRRSDYYHDIDTVMVPIDCYDTLIVRRTTRQKIELHTAWHPSREVWSATLGGDESRDALNIPDDERNLIHRAITATVNLFATNPPSEFGFHVHVRKRIPAGAGMGGASSDAAAAIRAVAALLGMEPSDDRLWKIASQIGCDVPFFLGDSKAAGRLSAVRATGRGEKLEAVSLGSRLRLIVAYPATSLSTAVVYRNCSVPEKPLSVEPMLTALVEGNIEKIGHAMGNRLTEPATKISPMVLDLLEQMWRCGLPRCQLTGSGSACFSLLDGGNNSAQLAHRLQATLKSINLHAHIIQAHTISIPTRLHTLKI